MSTALNRAAFALAKVKTLRGVENDALEASVTYEGKRIADILDDGWGGNLSIDYITPEWEKRVKEFCAAQPPHVCDDVKDPNDPEKQMEITFDDEWFYGLLIDAWYEAKDKARLDRASKTKTLFRLKGDAEGSWRSLSYAGKVTDPRRRISRVVTHDHEKAVAQIKKKYGDALECFYGEQEAEIIPAEKNGAVA